MSFAWFLLLLVVTVGNLALGFALACVMGHGPKWDQVWGIAEPILAPLLAQGRDSQARLIAAMWSTRSASAQKDAGRR